MPKILTAKALKQFLATVPDDAIIVTTGLDHEFRLAHVVETTALTRRGLDPVEDNSAVLLYEDYGKGSEICPEDYRIRVVNFF